jgi:dTDP-4-dehydrorhamnose reductase
MRVLVLGGAGMLGHRVWLSLRERFETFVTLRSDARAYARFGVFDAARTLEGVDGARFETVAGAFARVRPDVVVNCIGIVKQLAEASDPIASLEVNALLPHRVAALCGTAGARLVHISTDCVFSGRTGSYREEDVADADDLYGRTKLLGEVHGAGSLTLRTSIIGRELQTSHGLAEWFLERRGQRVRGFTRAFFSGLTTHALARVIGDVIAGHPGLGGLYHVSSERISKYDLLTRLNDALQARAIVEPVEEPRLDRSLDSARFWRATAMTRPLWAEMIAEMSAAAASYDEWRHRVVS